MSNNFQKLVLVAMTLAMGAMTATSFAQTKQLSCTGQMYDTGGVSHEILFSQRSDDAQPEFSISQVMMVDGRTLTFSAIANDHMGHVRVTEKVGKLDIYSTFVGTEMQKKAYLQVNLTGDPLILGLTVNCTAGDL